MKKISGLTAVLSLLIVAGLIGGSYYLLRPRAETANISSNAGVISPLPMWPTSDHPWPMFHGNYDHSGYTNVAGPTAGNLRWKYLIGTTEGNWPNSVVVAKDGTVFVAGDNKITALKADGTLKWAKEYPGSQGPGLSADGKTVYVASGSSLIAASSVDGSKQWEFKAAGNMVFGPTIGSDGTIYQGSWDKYFYAIDPGGSLKWKYLTKGTISYPASLDKNGHIYLGGGDAHFGPDGNVYAFDNTGKLLWTYDTKMLRVGTPAVGQDGLIYLPASPKLIVLNQDGKLQWQKGPDIPKPTVTAPGQPQSGEGAGDPAAGGAPLPGGQNSDSAPCAPPPAPCGNATGVDNAPGAAPAGAPAGGAEKLDNTGAPSAMTDVIAGIITPAIAPNGLIYIGNPQGKFMAIEAKTQEIKWSYQTGKNPEPGIDYGLPSFVLTDKNSTVYFGALDHKFYAVDKNGQLKWSYTTGGKITEASPALGADGTLYFTSEDGYIYAIEG